MNTNRDFDRIAGAWLAEGPSELTDRVLDAALDEVHLTHQRRHLRVPWRTPHMNTPLRLAAAMAIVAVAALGAMTFFRPDPGPGVTPRPSVSPSASPAPSATARTLDTRTWISYTSERYGFDIKRPPEWAETPSDHTWEIAEAGDILSGATEDFYYEPGEGLGVRVSAWSVGVEPGTSLDTWLQAYCGTDAGLCPEVMAGAVPITMDGQAGVSYAGLSEDSRALALVDDRVYIVTAWRTDNDPSVTEFGGGRRLVESFFSTMTLRADGPAPDIAAPALTDSFTSTLYGYSIDFPGAFWTATAGTELWVLGVDGGEGWSDTFLPPSTFNGFRAVSMLVPDGITPDDAWIDENLNGPGSECGPASSTLGTIVIDGQEGRVRYSCEEVEATVIADGRVYLFTLFLDAGEPYSTAGGRVLFEAMVSTVQLTPETAGAPSPDPS